MRSHSLVDYEPGSDYGNMRWYPKGYLIKRLLEEKVEDMCLSIGAMEVETPLMYDLDHTALRKYVEKFPARQYKVIADKGKDMFLRFAACFGQYLIAHDTTISYKHLPLRFFELAKSFRKEQHGELSGIKRLRSFTMPDMHTICADENQVLTEFKQQFNLAKEWAKIIEIEGEIAIRFVSDFYAKNKEFASELVKTWGKPALIEMWDSRYFYFVMKFEININDSVGKTFALSTVQIDVENTEAFDIEYIDHNNEKQNPYLLHTSVSGGVDRCVAAILETEEIKMRKGTKGSFPFWLSPTQVRLIPVNDDFTSKCISLEETIKGRVDIDDRDISIAKKIREAEKEWIPIIIVIGENEDHGIFKPRYRFQNDVEQLSLDELNALITSKMKNKPFRPTPLPKLLSKRPTFK
jgi:threonyl-tRNA synthetase